MYNNNKFYILRFDILKLNLIENKSIFETGYNILNKYYAVSYISNIIIYWIRVK